MSQQSWQRVSPFAVIFFLGQALTMILKNLWQAALPAGAFLFSTGGITTERLSYLAAVGFAVTVVYAVAAWWNTRFQLAATEIILKSGVFNRRQLNLEYANVQSVNETQNVIYRLSNVVDVQLDSPGSGDREVKLPALKPAVVRDIRRLVEQQKAHVDLSESEDLALPEDRSERVLRLNFADLIRIGLSSNRAVVFLAILGSAYGALATQDLPVSFSIDYWIGRWVRSLPEAQWGPAIALIVLAVIVGLMLLSVIGAIIRFYGFELFRDASTLRTRAGLLTRYTQALALVKIQMLSIQRGLLQQLFGIASLKISQIGSAKQASTSMQIPAVNSDHRGQLLDDVGMRPFEAALHQLIPRVSFRLVITRTVVIGVLPAALLIALAVPEGQTWEALQVAAVWLSLVTVQAYLSWRKLGMLTTNKLLVGRRGTLATYWRLFENHKTQAIHIKQSPFQRRRGLVTLGVTSAAGRIRVPYLKRDDADEIARDCLEAASSATKWR